MVLKNAECPWPFTKMKNESENGKNLAARFENGHPLILAIRWSRPLVTYKANFGREIETTKYSRIHRHMFPFYENASELKCDFICVRYCVNLWGVIYFIIFTEFGNLIMQMKQFEVIQVIFILKWLIFDLKTNRTALRIINFTVSMWNFRTILLPEHSRAFHKANFFYFLYRHFGFMLESF